MNALALSGSRTVDRRESYYARMAGRIAADPLAFYCRAERGRRWQYSAFQQATDYEREAIGTAQPEDPSYEH